jgi:hypothetical protein
MVWKLKSGYPEFAVFSNLRHPKFNDIDGKLILQIGFGAEFLIV